MKAILRKQPLCVALLPAFFVMHGVIMHTGHIALSSIWPLLLAFLGGTGLVYLVSLLLLKHPAKAGIFTLYCCGFYFFFGAIYDFLKDWSPWAFLWKYSVLLLGFLTTAILLFFYLFRSNKKFSRTIFFFNLLLLAFIAADIVKLIFSVWPGYNGEKTPVAASKMIIPPQVQKPDIYLLLFDEYSSSRSLKTLYHFDNSALDSFLIQLGFHLIPGSKSNYPETSFSMASCLNMDYLDWAKAGMEIKREHHQRCASEIRNNAVVKVLSDNGYQIMNHSIFHLKHHPSPVSQRWLSIDTRLITEETLLSRLCHEFNWFFNRYALLRKLLPVTSYEEQIFNNDRCLSGVLAESAVKTKQPRFVYGHFLLPHFPFYKDKNGKLLQDSIVNGVMQGKLDPLPHYLEYIQYANIEAKKLIAGIRANAPGAVIIFMSDHGNRWQVPEPINPNVFYNQNAVYLPSGKYEQFHDSITNVNQFRILFNTLFDLQYQLLPDSCILTGQPKSHIEQIEQYEK